MAFSSKKRERGWQLGRTLKNYWRSRALGSKVCCYRVREAGYHYDTSKDHETCLALGNEVMLPQDVADVTVEGLEELRDLMIMQGIQEGWLACLKELSTPSDHPTWIATAPPVELLDPPVVYSLLILSGFNEEEYMNQPVDEKGGVTIGEVSMTRGNKLGGGEGEEVEDAKGGVGEGNPNTPPKE
ncbi:hypothetical protein Acr_07g0013900 [Actinidia rufa]|uniref:Uncharacterized protein n=1 Tax=Actinidia rufa TaxID=165716 RepID=A0A7J0EXK3_9ERIC|nr:hypothetical protein Acr_07g0013900 [Actinidia rufa]